MCADIEIAMRPAIQRPTRSAKGRPLKGNRPVQFGIAVKRKPLIAADRYP